MEKRLYTSGYHIDWHNGKHAKGTVETVEKRENASVAETALETKSFHTVDVESANQVEAVEAEVVSASSDQQVVILSAPAALEARAMEASAVSQNDIAPTIVAASKASKAAAPKGGDKEWLVAFLLCLFLGALGLHRFYLGYTWQGIVQLLTFGGFGIWAFIDLIRIAFKSLKPKNGDYN